MPEAFEIPITDTHIKLGQLIKLASLVDDGANAREAIESGLVRVDGEVEIRRGRKVLVGSVVEFAGQKVTVVSG